MHEQLIPVHLSTPQQPGYEAIIMKCSLLCPLSYPSSFHLHVPAEVDSNGSSTTSRLADVRGSYMEDVGAIGTTLKQLMSVETAV